MPFSIPDLNQSLHIFGESPQEKFTTLDLSCLVWNVFKGRREKAFAQDIAQLSSGKPLVLLQETLNNEMLNLIQKTNPDHHWKMGTSFEYWYGNQRTGVSTGSFAKAHNTQLIRPTQRELFVWTPKVTLVSEYLIDGTDERLMVINTHAINFVTTSSFRDFLSALGPIMAAHQGPMILGGDFNTWNSSRFEALLELTRTLNLSHGVFEEDSRFLKLDHIFWRGFDLVDAQIHSKIQSSDHFPLDIKLRFRG